MSVLAEAVGHRWVGTAFAGTTLAEGTWTWRAKVPSTSADPLEGFMAGARATPAAANATPGARPTATAWSPPPASHHVTEIGRRIALRLSALRAEFPHRHASDGDASNPTGEAAGEAIGEATQTPFRESC